MKKILIPIFLLCMSFFAGEVRADSYVPSTSDLGRGVVLIKAYASNDDNEPVLISQGSGVFLDSQGTILTNYHVINNSERSLADKYGYLICVDYGNNSDASCDYYGEFVAADKDKDVAILKAKSSNGEKVNVVNYFKRADYNPAMGSEIGVFGYPGIGGNSITYSKGIISGYQKMGDYNLLKTDALISFGSSGGALIDNSNNLIGIAKSKYGAMGYAIPVADINSWIDSNINNEPVTSSLLDQILRILHGKRGFSGSLVLHLDDISVQRPDDWSFDFTSDNNFDIYKKDSSDGGFVSIRVFKMPYKASINSVLGFLKLKYSNSLNVLSVKEQRLFSLGLGKMMRVNNGVTDYNIFGTIQNDKFIYVSYYYGKNGQDKDVVEKILSGSVKKVSGKKAEEPKSYSYGQAINLSVGGKWSLKPINSGNRLVEAYSSKYPEAKVTFNIVENAPSSDDNANKEIIEFANSQSGLLNGFYQLSNVKMETVKSSSNFSPSKNLKKITMISSVIKENDKVKAQIMTYYIYLFNDKYLNISLSFFGSDVKAFNAAVKDFNLILPGLKINFVSMVSERIDKLVYEAAYASAISVLKKIDAVSPNDYAVLNYIGLIMNESFDSKNAIKYLTSSIKLNAKYRPARNNLGNAYSSIGDYKRAETEYKKCISLDPGHPNCYYNIGNLYNNTKKYDLAIANYNKAISLNESKNILGNDLLDSYYYQMAFAYYNKKDYVRAQGYLDTYISKYPDNEGAISLQNKINAAK